MRRAGQNPLRSRPGAWFPPKNLLGARGAPGPTPAAADWSSCNGTDPNNVGGNTYDVTISTGDPTLTTAVTIGSVTINSPGAWTLTGSGASATLTGSLSNSGTFGLHDTGPVTVSGGFTNSGTLDVDNVIGVNFAEGGSSLTIAGTLDDTGAVQIGNGDLSATTTLTLGGLTNPTGASFHADQTRLERFAVGCGAAA
jgi:hypothetical protein